MRRARWPRGRCSRWCARWAPAVGAAAGGWRLRRRAVPSWTTPRVRAEKAPPAATARRPAVQWPPAPSPLSASSSCPLRRQTKRWRNPREISGNLPVDHARDRGPNLAGFARSFLWISGFSVRRGFDLDHAFPYVRAFFLSLSLFCFLALFFSSLPPTSGEKRRRERRRRGREEGFLQIARLVCLTPNAKKCTF